MTEKTKPRLVLGSSSPRRLDLLKQIGYVPDIVQAPDIDETARKNELPRDFCLRMALEKNAALVERFPHDVIITADNIIALGRRIVGKPEDRRDAERIIRLLSGRTHQVMTVIAVHAPGHAVKHRLNVSKVKFKRLNDVEIQTHLDSGEWEGVSGAYRLQGSMAQNIIAMHGSPSGIIGLPLYETAQLLKGIGYAASARRD